MSRYPQLSQSPSYEMPIPASAPFRRRAQYDNKRVVVSFSSKLLYLVTWIVTTSSIFQSYSANVEATAFLISSPHHHCVRTQTSYNDPRIDNNIPTARQPTIGKMIPTIITVQPRFLYTTSMHNTKVTTCMIYATSSTNLYLGKNVPDENSKNTNGSNIDVDGMETAPYLFTFILLLCVWNFTIPTEFRRARLCSEQQVIDYPNSNCKTWSQYTNGIQEYYRNGGSWFQFDFSIDRENNIWITGPQEIIE
jgi:hypothetical protein